MSVQKVNGSCCEVRTRDLEKCAAFKDFGKGFYLTSSKEQAESFINVSLKKAKEISSKLWWNGPSYIADMYKKEIAAMQNDL